MKLTWRANMYGSVTSPTRWEGTLATNKRGIKYYLLFIKWSSSSTQDQTLGHWQVKRQIGSGTPIVYKFPPKFNLKAGQTVTVRIDLQRNGHLYLSFKFLTHFSVSLLSDLGCRSWRNPQPSFWPGVEDSKLMGQWRSVPDHSRQRQWGGGIMLNKPASFLNVLFDSRSLSD